MTAYFCDFLESGGLRFLGKKTPMNFRVGFMLCPQLWGRCLLIPDVDNTWGEKSLRGTIYTLHSNLQFFRFFSFLLNIGNFGVHVFFWVLVRYTGGLDYIFSE